MDTNLNIPIKRVVSVEILHLDELGYGPQGMYTRRQWRAECLKYVALGKDAFKLWQHDWRISERSENNHAHFGYKQFFSDGSIRIFEKDIGHRCTLDFVAHIFNEFDAGSYEFLQEDTRFNGSEFKGTPWFVETKFNGVHFSNSKFEGARFERALFTRDAFFDEAYFAWCPMFHDINFNWKANFNNTNFNDRSYFSNTIFNQEAGFCNASFNKDVVFNSATFKGDILFGGSTFNGDASFNKVIFNNQCRFHNKYNKEKKIWGKETSFCGQADFENATFDNVGHFERVNFTKEIPSFLGVNIAATRLEFSDDHYFDIGNYSDRDVKRLGQLKRLADEHGQTDQTLNFNAMELRAKRLQTEPKTATRSFKTITWLYEKLSDYGRSFTKPLFWYAVLICLSALFAMIYSTYSDSPPQEQQVLCKPIKDQPPPLKLPYGRAVVEYAMFRAGGVLDFTDTGKQNNAVNCRLFEEPIEPPLMRAWGIFKGIASIALLFLAALGLRNKYRIK